MELRDGYAELSEARLHYVEAGEGPLVVLLHGFPEFWYGWRRQIPALAAAGLRVLAPDMRGYNTSAKPPGVGAYAVERLARDVSELIQERGERSACVVGHDWGGWVAWYVAMNHPEAVERLAVLNIPHPRRMLHALRGPRQLAKSRYIVFFQLPALPERLVALHRWRLLRRGALGTATRADAFSPQDIERYLEAWSQPGAMSAMMNYYRAAARRSPRRTEAAIGVVRAPTLVIWGERDAFIGRELAEPDPADVPNLERVVRLPEASHWVQHDEPERVNQLLSEFLARRGGDGPPAG